MEHRPYINSFKPITRVGNWNEDLFLAAEIEKDFERRKANGELKHQKLEKIRTQFLSPVNTSPHGDKVVSMGDIVMLKNLHLSHSIAVFSDNQIHYSVTASSEAGAQTRNTFKVVPYTGELDDICIGSPLRYNQVFCLQSVCNPEFYLASDSIRKLNTLSNIAYGRNEVFLVDKKSRLTGFSCIAWDPENRLETELEPIEQNYPLIINHHASGQALCVESTKTKWSPFGRELEVCASTRLNPHKAHSQLNCFSLTVQP